MRLGIDVGSSNTDATIITEHAAVIEGVKERTTADIITGIERAIDRLLFQSKLPTKDISGVFVGTTHSMNAINYGNGLAKTLLIRILPEKTAILPCIGFNKKLRQYLKAMYTIEMGDVLDPMKGLADHLLHISLDEINEYINEFEIESIAIVGSFSPVYPSIEDDIAEKINQSFPQIHVSVSHQISTVGYIERENATILNAMLSKVLINAVQGIRKILHDKQITCPCFLTQNDGSLLPLHDVVHYPIRTIGSGVSNNFRGAAIASGLSDCVVIDIGGYTTEIGRVKHYQPQETYNQTTIRGIRMNIRMPKTTSLLIGGGSIIDHREHRLVITDKVVTNLKNEGLYWGGEICTLTDLFFRVTEAEQNLPQSLKQLDKEQCLSLLQGYVEQVQNHIDHFQTNGERLPIVIVGGGSSWFKSMLKKRYQTIIQPTTYRITNAIGACFAPISETLDQVIWLQHHNKASVIEAAKETVIYRLKQYPFINQDTIAIKSIEEYPFAYMRGEVIRIRVKATGEINI